MNCCWLVDELLVLNRWQRNDVSRGSSCARGMKLPCSIIETHTQHFHVEELSMTSAMKLVSDGPRFPFLCRYDGRTMMSISALVADFPVE